MFTPEKEDLSSDIGYGVITSCTAIRNGRHWTVEMVIIDSSLIFNTSITVPTITTLFFC